MPNPTIEDLKQGLLDLLKTPLNEQPSSIMTLVDMAELAGDSRYLEGFNKGAEAKTQEVIAVLKPKQTSVEVVERINGFELVDTDSIKPMPRRRKPAAAKSTKPWTGSKATDFDALSVFELGLTTKTAKALERAGYSTVGKLRKLTVAKLQETPRIGKLAVKDVIDQLGKLGIKLAS